MPNHPPVTRNLQPKSVPSEPSFLGADECAKTDAHADHNQDRQPPIRNDAVMNLHQDSRRQRKGAANLGHEPGQLRHHVRDEDCDQRRAGDCQKRRIDQRLLNAVAQVLRLHQMFYEPVQNLRQRPACFARRNKIDNPSSSVMPAWSKCASCSVKMSSWLCGIFKACLGAVAATDCDFSSRSGRALTISIRIGMQRFCSIWRMAMVRSAQSSTPSTSAPCASRAR